MPATGTWKVVFNTPLGDNHADFEFEVDRAVLKGLLRGPMESPEIFDGQVDGDQLAWSVQVTKPFEMRLDFTATVAGDAISGVARGPFFAIPFAGRRP